MLPVYVKNEALETWQAAQADQAAAIAHLQLENAKFRDVLEFYKCFSDSRISSIAQTALLNITTAEEVTHNKPDDERKEFEDWLEDFKAQHEEWQYADSEAMYFAAWQARANLSMQLD